MESKYKDRVTDVITDFTSVIVLAWNFHFLDINLELIERCSKCSNNSPDSPLTMLIWISLVYNVLNLDNKHYIISDLLLRAQRCRNIDSDRMRIAYVYVLIRQYVCNANASKMFSCNVVICTNLPNFCKNIDDLKLALISRMFNSQLQNLCLQCHYFFILYRI